MSEFASDQIVDLTFDWRGFKIELNYKENGIVSESPRSRI